MGRIRKQRHGAIIDGPTASTKTSATRQAAGSLRHHAHLAEQERERRFHHELSDEKPKKVKVKKS